jgi:hemerythrin
MNIYNYSRYTKLDQYGSWLLSSINKLERHRNSDLAEELLVELFSTLTLQVIQRFNEEEKLMRDLMVPKVVNNWQHTEHRVLLEEMTQLHCDIMHKQAPPLLEAIPLLAERIKQHIACFDVSIGSQ